MNMQQLGFKIRELRKQKGLSQQELADGVCSVGYISIIENGRFTGDISVEKLSAISLKLGVKLQDLLNEIKPDDLEIEMLLDIVKVSILRGEFDYALDLIKQLEKKDNLLQYQKQQITLSLANCLIKKGDADQAITVLSDFSKSLEATQSTDQYVLATVSNLLGNAHHKKHDLITAHSHYTRAHQLSSGFPAEDLLSANITYNLGITCQSLRNDLHARLYLENAMKLYKKLGDKRRLANSLYWLGITLKNLDQLERAGDYIKQSLVLYEAENIFKMAEFAKSQYAFYITSVENPEQAISDIYCSLEVFESLGDVSTWAFENLRIANLYLDSSETLNVLEILESIQARLTEVEEPMVTAYFYRTYSRYLSNVKRYDESLENSFKSAEIFGKMGLEREKATSLRQAVDTYQMQGKKDEAFSLLLEVTDIFSKAIDFLVIT